MHPIQSKYYQGYTPQPQPQQPIHQSLPQSIQQQQQQYSQQIRQTPLYSNPTDTFQSMKTSLYKTTQSPYSSTNNNSISLTTSLSKYSKMTQRMSTPSQLSSSSSSLLQQPSQQQQQQYSSMHNMMNPLQQTHQPYNPYNNNNNNNSKNLVDQIARSQKRKRITETVEPLKKEYIDRITEEDKWNGKNCIFDPKDFIQMVISSIPSNILLCSCKVFTKRNVYIYIYYIILYYSIIVKNVKYFMKLYID